MRKKLFAVIMSAMMMITFMPAMAFAAAINDNAAQAVTPGFHVSGLHAKVTDATDFTYDGKDHTVTFAPKTAAYAYSYETYYADGELVEYVEMKVQKNRPSGEHWVKVKEDGSNSVWIRTAHDYQEVVKAEEHFLDADQMKTVKVEYNVLAMNARNTADTEWIPATGVTWTGFKADAPVIKNAGKYDVVAKVSFFDSKSGQTYVVETDEETFTINRRSVEVTPKAMIKAMTKVYDGEGFAITDALLNIEADKTTATDLYNTGLIAGESLFVTPFKTIADAGVYTIDLKKDKNVFNANYNVIGNVGFDVVITKATPNVKVTSNELKIKRGKNAKVKYSTNLGTAKLTKQSGNAKITLKNGKLYVKKSLKKGTYKVTVKAEVAEGNNWNAAKRVKTLTIKVK